MEQAKQHHQAGRLAEAERLYREFLAGEPENAEALHGLGIIAFQTGRREEGLGLIRRAIDHDPGRAQFHNNLGLVLSDSDVDAAVAAFRKAIALQPNFREALRNLWILLNSAGRRDEAAEVCRHILRVDPNSVEAHAYLCGVLMDMEQAIAHGRRALELKPDTPEVHHGLAIAYKETGRMEEAIDHYRRALELNPEDLAAYSDLLYALYFDPRCGLEQLYLEHRRWAEQHADRLKPGVLRYENDPNPNRRIRVGYVSPDFRAHPVGRFMLPLLRGHDRGGFEIYCYDTAIGPDGFTPRIRPHGDVWREATKLSDEELAELIRRDRIDILVDLTLHTGFNRMLVFARKPAPIQVSYLAYPGTTGLETMDYRITDPHLEPYDTPQEYFSERTVWLRRSYWCYEPLSEGPAVQALPAWRNGFVTFGCFNNFCKVSDATLETWGELLAGIAGSRLVLHVIPGRHRERVQAILGRHGVNGARLTFVDRTPLAEYMHLYDGIDIALDPFPYPGGTTTCDALWMGVPVVTLCGTTGLGRMGVSILTNVGLPDLIAASAREYVLIAAGLANDLERLKHLRATLRERMRGSPLMDSAGFAADFERIYREMWKTWCGTSLT